MKKVISNTNIEILYNLNWRMAKKKYLRLDHINLEVVIIFYKRI